MKATDRSDYGEGSVYQRKDGTWTARFTLGYGENGKRKVKAFYGKTENTGLRMAELIGLKWADVEQIKSVAVFLSADKEASREFAGHIPCLQNIGHVA